MEEDNSDAEKYQRRMAKIKHMKELITKKFLPVELGGMKPLEYEEGDDQVVKDMKRREYEERLALRNKQREAGFNEKKNFLDEIIKRVQSSKHDTPIDQVDYTSNDATEQMSAQYACPRCKNNNQQDFIFDTKTGDVVCIGKNREGCGNVVQNHMIDEGAEFRIFAEEEDRNHHGGVADPLLPESENLRTSMFVGISRDKGWKKLFRANQNLEMNLSTIGNDDRRTRTGYRTQQKKQAFEMMANAMNKLGINRMVLDDAKALFARYRDVKEHVHDFNGVVGACIAIAYSENVLNGFDTDIVEKRLMPSAIESNSSTSEALKSNKYIENIEKHGDVALATLVDIPMNHWSVNQVELWCKTITQTYINNNKSDNNIKNNDDDGSKIMQQLEKCLKLLKEEAPKELAAIVTANDTTQNRPSFLMRSKGERASKSKRKKGLEAQLTKKDDPMSCPVVGGRLFRRHIGTFTSIMINNNTSNTTSTTNHDDNIPLLTDAIKRRTAFDLQRSDNAYRQHLEEKRIRVYSGPKTSIETIALSNVNNNNKNNNNNNGIDSENNESMKLDNTSELININSSDKETDIDKDKTSRSSSIVDPFEAEFEGM